MAYASRTGTRKNNEALRAAGWRVLVSAAGVLRTEGFDHHAVDCGSWTAYQRWLKGLQPTPMYDEGRFVRVLTLLGATADWVVAPDIVTGGLESLALSLQWIPRILDVAPMAMLAVQDGMTIDDVAPHVGDRVGIFVGGGDVWKIQTLPMWCEYGRRAGVWVHAARVNTAKRIALAADHGAASFDGSSASRYVKTLPLLDRSRRRLDLWGSFDAHDTTRRTR